MAPVIDQIRGEAPEKRKQYIIDVFCSAYSDLMGRDPDAWRGKYRKMAATPFAFYRGSAALFYADLARDEEPFGNEQTSRIWIQGDLHAANFGTYMNSQGVLVFDVNDFDEAYVAPFTWDVKRLVASLALLGYEKALSDDEIREMVRTTVRSYVRQVATFANTPETQNFALTLSNTKGKLLDVLRATRLNTRWGLLQRFTQVENYDRRFIIDRSTSKVDAETRKKVEKAFEEYLTTIPESKRFNRVSYNIKDVVAKRGVGIGSAGLPSFNVLVEGNTQALENDIIIYMKQAQTASPSRVIEDPNIKGYFQHDGHRTVLSQRALQAYADPWLGYTTLNGAGQLVAEASPYVADLDWTDINDMDDILELLTYLGQAVAKVHCVSDVDSDLTLVPFSTDKALNAVLQGREEEFVTSMLQFAEGYGEVVRDDYRYFVDAFRNHQIAGL
ncbi:MAG TPA: DUF2252 domain-containing protein [Chloroflexia bacterium]|nr:DUF2252 domain-containing protein [Chloroflexia bacterium]